MLINFCLPPEICTHTEHLLSVGVIPGPYSPTALDSFFIPLSKECILLAFGIPTYDAMAKEMFNLHAYLIIFSGDLPAISKLLSLKSHGAYCPCRYCLIIGQQNHGSRSTQYYPVLTPPWRPGNNPDNGWDPYELPLHMATLLSWREEEYSRRDREDISFLSVLFHFTFMPTPVHTHLIIIFLQPQESSQDPQIFGHTFYTWIHTILQHPSLYKQPTSRGTLHTSMSTYTCTLTCIYAVQWLPPSHNTCATVSTRTTHILSTISY